jgi:hypothetical protein
MSDLLSALPVPLSDQIAELKRERKQRKRVYPRFITDGKLTRDAADQQMARLDAAIATLERTEGGDAMSAEPERWKMRTCLCCDGTGRVPFIEGDLRPCSLCRGPEFDAWVASRLPKQVPDAEREAESA